MHTNIFVAGNNVLAFEDIITQSRDLVVYVVYVVSCQALTLSIAPFAGPCSPVWVLGLLQGRSITDSYCGCTKSASHHFETIRCLFAGAPPFQVLFAGAGFRPSTVSAHVDGFQYADEAAGRDIRL